MGHSQWDCYLVAVTIGLLALLLVNRIRWLERVSRCPEVLVAIIITATTLVLCGWLTRW